MPATPLTLAELSTTTVILIAVGALAIGAAVGVVLLRLTIGGTIRTAKRDAEHMRQTAQAEAAAWPAPEAAPLTWVAGPVAAGGAAIRGGQSHRHCWYLHYEMPLQRSSPQGSPWRSTAHFEEVAFGSLGR